MDKIKKAIRNGCLIINILFLVIFVLLIMIIWATSYVDYEDLGDGYNYCYEWKFIEGPVDVPGVINKYAYDNTYIVASQDYRNVSYEKYDIGEYKDVWFGSIDSDKDGRVYWIVNKKTNRNILCVTETEFVEKCKSIGVSDALIRIICPLQEQ